MSEKTVSQVQHGSDGWRKLWEEQVGRVTAAQEQAAKLEAQWMDNLQASVDQAATMAKQTLSYATQLSAEWRKLSAEAARRATELFSVRA